MSDNTVQDQRIPEENTVPQVPSSAKQERDQDEILGRPTAIAYFRHTYTKHNRWIQRAKTPYI